MPVVWLIPGFGLVSVNSQEVQTQLNKAFVVPAFLAAFCRAGRVRRLAKLVSDFGAGRKKARQRRAF